MGNEIQFVDVFEPIAITGMGVALVLLAFRLHHRGILMVPAAVALGIAGVLAAAWKYPEVTFMPDDLRLPFEVAQVQFFVALSICMTLFALDVFIGQARQLAKAQEVLALQAAELEKAAVVQHMAAIIESSEDAIMSASLDGSVVSWNSAAERIFGISRDQALGTALTSFVDIDRRGQIDETVAQTADGTRFENLSTVCVRADGALFDGMLSLAPIKNPDGGVTGVSVIARDVTDTKRAEELERQAFTDELTGLNNRRGFITQAERYAAEAIAEGRGFSILFMDLNGLKAINDNLGHLEGDSAIADAAAVLKETFRDRDVLARLGGDEFCVLLAEDKEAVGESVGARLQAMLDIHNLQGGRPYKVSMSVGIARFDPQSPCGVDELIERADAAMYEDKMSGVKRFSLLVCDDDPSICNLVEAMFSEDYDVSKAYSGRQVVAAAASQRPDLILLDLNLPDMLGTEVVRHLRKDPNTKLTPIIMITGAGDSSSEIESLRAGVDDYVAKPFDEDALRARMDIVLKRKLHR